MEVQLYDGLRTPERSEIVEVQLYDGRIGEWRSRDVPVPLEEEIVVSRLSPGGGRWYHDVYRRIGQQAFEFIGYAPSTGRGEPAFQTITHRGYLQPYWETIQPYYRRGAA